jgi:dTDP-glucose 4,6-dehydratase
MRILVTGHLGTIGRPLVALFRSGGHEVIGVDLRHSEDGIRADVAEYRQLQCLPDFDFCYHLAAEFGRHNGESFTEQLWKTNVIGTKNMLRLQKERGFRMVFASSSEVYGERYSNVLREDLPMGPLPNDYAISKQVNEQQIANSDGETMVLRFFNAYGPGEYYHSYRSVVCLFVYRALMGLPYTVYSNYWRVFQYVDDLVATLGRCVESFHPGEVINVGGTEYRSVEGLHALVSEIVGVDPNRPEVTFAPEDVHNVVSKRPSIEKARSLLGHDPKVQLEDGLKRTVEWMREVYGQRSHAVLHAATGSRQVA